MKFSLLALALGAIQAVQLDSQNAAELSKCEEALDVSQEELDIQLDYFSRRLDRKYYDNAMKIYGELTKNGKNPQLSVHTWELYDKSFSFPRVRRYDFVQEHMDNLQHFQDNLNQNFAQSTHVDNFLRVAHTVEDAFNAKYHDGEFSDPANFDPQEEHKVTWATVKM